MDLVTKEARVWSVRKRVSERVLEGISERDDLLLLLNGYKMLKNNLESSLSEREVFMKEGIARIKHLVKKMSLLKAENRLLVQIYEELMRR